MGAGRSKLILDLILEAEGSTSLSANADKPHETPYKDTQFWRVGDTSEVG
jgi:hypothetical protein